MSRKSRIAIFPVTATLVLTSIGFADTRPQDEISQLRGRVAELEATVARLQTNEQEDWLTTQRAHEIRALVQDVLADADTRATLLQDGLTAGWDKKFFLASADGNFRLNIAGQIQFRFVYNSQGNSPDDDDRWGFENRRSKLNFSGHVVDPSWKYQIQGAFKRDGGDFVLEDANFTKVFENGWNLRFGQYKPPFMREELVSSKRQLAVARSLLNEEFNQDRAQGVELGYSGDTVAAKVMYSDGTNTDNTSALAEETEFAITARAEWLAAGTWKQFKDFTSWEGDDTGVLVGVGVLYEKDEFGTGDGLFVDADGDGADDTPNDSEAETLSLTADISMEFGGANLFGAVVYRSIEIDGGADSDQLGFVIQGGVFLVPDEWEAFARYEFGDLDTTGVEDLSVITVGVTRYISKHSLKWTTDVGFALDEISAPWNSSGAGWRTDGTGEDGQVVVRSQFQLLF